MKIVYGNKKVERHCSDLKAALKLFGGNKELAISLLARVNAIKNAKVIKDIIVIQLFRFHRLRGDLKRYFAIDVKSVRDKWRIILEPLDENEERFDPCNIDEIATFVYVVRIKEVSPHYE
ncbi:MAG: type II toxin-antitoxin system RelE/ParE family toxin [Clostridiales bacterium]|nr:type II toxin-antitoxin system RelE/ParE family toxin [Clostridiales bacterium]